MTDTHTVRSRNFDLCLIGKLISDKPFNPGGLKSALARSWNTEGDVEILKAGKNIFLLKFQLLIDKKSVWSGSPWSFSQDLFTLAEFKPNVPADKCCFSFYDLWLQFYGLPLEYMSKNIALDLISKLGATPVEPDHLDLLGGRSSSVSKLPLIFQSPPSIVFRFD